MVRNRLVLVAASCSLAALLVACGSSGGSEGATATTGKDVATTTADVGTTTTATADDGGGGPSTTVDSGTATELPPCQELLEEYARRFTMDDLTDAAAFFREYAPYMPEEVAKAVGRIADAYEATDGDPAQLNFADQDLTADAQTFSDWTAEGCPAG